MGEDTTSAVLGTCGNGDQTSGGGGTTDRTRQLGVEMEITETLEHNHFDRQLIDLINNQELRQGPLSYQMITNFFGLLHRCRFMGV